MTAPDPEVGPTDKPTTDGREDQLCPRCGALCRYDGWDHVHQNGIGIGSCRCQYERLIAADFYRCPNTGEWVYRWSDERLVLKAAPLRPVPAPVGGRQRDNE